MATNNGPAVEKPANFRTLIISMGGTMFQRFNQFKNAMETSVTVEDILSELNLPETVSSGLDQLDFGNKAGAELLFSTIFKIRDVVIDKVATHDSFILVSSIDTLDELAFSLSLLLDAFLKSKSCSFVITGATKSHDMEGYDGFANFGDALKVSAAPFSKQLGVVVAINEDVHLGRYVVKSDSQLARAFKSYPGCIGNMRNGVPLFYYLPLANDAITEDFLALKSSQLKTRVCVWTVTVGNFLPDSLLSQIDGLVLAAPGSGSLPQALISQLSPLWTKRLPIVISSRCHSGNNNDSYAFRGSKETYENKGFIISGFENLNPLQARILLIFRLSLLQENSADCVIM